MKSRILTIAACLLAGALAQPVLAQAASQYDAYIERYKDIAMRDMNDFGIPASITLAQGILESGGGQSELALRANNHFGIKCHSDWQGAVMYHDDDRSQECFRKYDTPEESFNDHALFLKSKARYSFLFELDKLDYKAWAKGLKQAGYATDPTYASRLTDLIETHRLAQYDTLAIRLPLAPKAVPEKNETGLKHVTAGPYDTYYVLGKRYHIPFNLIYRYNDVVKGSREPKPGDVVYLQKKRKRVLDSQPALHVVAQGESMHAIAQRYGIQVHWLYNLNNMPYTAVPSVGQTLKLR